MRINEENFDACKDYVLNNTEIKELIKIAFNDQVDEEDIESITYLIIHSLMIELIAKKEERDISSDYAVLGAMKKNDVYRTRKEFIEEKELEKTFAEGIKEFLEVFSDEFVNYEILLKSFRKIFKNYKFKKMSIINNYTIFYFTFKMFDFFCDDCDDVEEWRIKADAYAELAYDELKNKKITVSCENMPVFVKKFEVDNYKYIYVRIMVDFVQSLCNSSTLSQVSLYSFFSRFHKHIAWINYCLKPKNVNTKRSSQNIISRDDSVNLYDFIKYRIKCLQKMGVDTNITNDINMLYKLISKLIRKSNKFEKLSQKELSHCCSQVYEITDRLIKCEDLSAKEYINDILKKLAEVTVVFEGNEISLYELACNIVTRDSGKVLSKHCRGKIDENAYIWLILPFENIYSNGMSEFGKLPYEEKNKDNYIKFIDKPMDLWLRVMDDIYDYIKQNFILNAKAFEDIISRKAFDILALPIFELNEKDSEYITKIQFSSLVLFYVMGDIK